MVNSMKQMVWNQTMEQEMTERKTMLRKCGRVFVMMLWSVILVLTLASTAFAAGNTTDFAGGSGTASDPYLISTKVHLNNVRNKLSAHYKLMANITFTSSDFSSSGEFYNGGAGWEPIGSSSSSFRGTFDGNGYTISGLYQRITSTGNYGGLFGKMSGATVEDLGVLNLDISITVNSSNNVCIGGIAGNMESSSTVNNCYSTGKITGSSDSTWRVYAGGITGYAGSGTISGCYNLATVSTKASSTEYADAGGIVGYGNTNTISDCYNEGKITGGYTGGIVGYASFGSISGCYNTGTVTGDNNGKICRAGGIVGYSHNSISECYNTGSITASSSSSALCGGIAGQSTDPIEACYNLGAVTAKVTGSDAGNAKAGGIAGSLSGDVSRSYNTGAVTASASSSANVFLGGIAGDAYGSNAATPSVRNCYNTGTVKEGASSTASKSYVGGITGRAENTGAYSRTTTVSNCYNTGSVKGTSAEAYVGGVAGYKGGHTDILKCYYLDTSDVGIGSGTGTTTPCTAADMKQEATFSNLDFDGIWTMWGNSDYLYPELISVSMVYTKTLQRIAVTSEPTKKVYEIGEPFDKTGLVVTAYYDNGTSVKVTPSISFDSSTVGKKSVGLSYGGKTVYITVEVVEPAFDQIHCVCGKTNCSGAGHDPEQGWVGTATLPKEAGYWCLTEDVVLTKGWSPKDGTYLCLNGHTISAERGIGWQEVSRMIEVDSGVTFTLTDCGTEVTRGYIDTDHIWKAGNAVPSGATEYDITGGMITGGTICGVDVEGTFIMYGGSICGNGTENSGSGAGVDATGTFRLYGGTICGNTANNGAGVYVNGGGDMAMSGGRISDNYAALTGGGIYVYGDSYNANTESALQLSGGTVSGNEAQYGGGVAAVYQGIVTMTGGEISRNTAPHGNHVGGGGGAYVSTNSSFDMSNGAVSENSSSDYGGGFYLDHGSNAVLTISGGEISENIAVSAGGGIAAQYSSTVTVTSGVISGNQMTGSYRGGGGIYCDGLLNLYGGTIRDNQAELGAGIALDSHNGNMNVKGAPVVAGNTRVDGTADDCSANGVALTVTGALSAGAEIGLRDRENSIVVVKDPAYDAKAENYKDCFFSDDEKLALEVHTDGTSLILKHIHTPEAFEAVPATCEDDGYESGTRCAVCKEVLSGGATIPALGHKYVNYVSNGDATCVKDGTKTARCENGCAFTHTIPDEGSATGEHSFTEYVRDNSTGVETAACDYGCGTTDSRSFDMTVGITVEYDKGTGGVAILNMQEELKVVLAVYLDGRLAFCDVPAVKSTIITSIPEEVCGDTLKVFFLTSGCRPAGMNRTFTM